MSGPRKNRGGNFKGKKDTRKYLRGKEGKTEEIKKALTHRARLRKNYFKLLEREGLDVPDKEGEKLVGVEGESCQVGDSGDATEHTNSAKSEIEIIKDKIKNKEALTFQERILLKKHRRESDKQIKMERIREKLETMRKKKMEREHKTERIQNTMTRKGQPLMGPRINNLLDKIRQEKKSQ